METAAAAGLRAGVRLEAVSIAWMIAEAAISLGAGIAAGSLLLTAFGADSVLELASAALLLRCLKRQIDARFADNADLERIERKTAKLAGFLLYGLSGYVILQALYGLAHRHHAETPWLGVGVAVIAALGMPPLARAKIKVADEIGSRALRADAMETLTCGHLAWALLAGLVANAVLHWWWLDSVFALGIVPLLIKEGREAVSGECACGRE